MGKIKKFEINELEVIGAEITAALNAWIKVWEYGMKGMRINSHEYRKLCRTGKNIQELRDFLMNYAVDRFPESEYNFEDEESIFPTPDKICAFN